MSAPTYFLSWESHRTNICNGLSVLQQNEEFVDMTLAADGHHVKVHQMVMALASPYIKELISATDCRHPIIFLHKTSYATLSAILEYIYTGEVVIAMDNLQELVEAARELRIRGLEDMKLQTATLGEKMKLQQQPDNCEDSMDDVRYFEVIDNVGDKAETKSHDYKILNTSISEGLTITDNMEDYVEENVEEPEDVPLIKRPKLNYDSDKDMDTEKVQESPNWEGMSPPAMIQYTVSNQGSLQMILNRFMYYLKHCNRKNSRQWRCVDYLNTAKCPAIVVTNKDDVVIQRISAHNHSFHDKRILKKVTAGAVYGALQDAEVQGSYVRSRNKNGDGHTSTND